MISVIHEGFGEQAVLTAFPDSPFVVMKFGGTSVSTVENWRTIAGLIRQRLDAGLRPVLVHSALSGVSNALQSLSDTVGDDPGLVATIRQRHQALARDLGVDPALCEPLMDHLEQLVEGVRLVGETSPRVRARIMVVGELAATTLGAAFLERGGLPVLWRDARELLQCLDLPDQSERAAFLSAVCGNEQDTELQRELLETPACVVTQGFIARNGQGDTVLLGRGGSDTSAAYFATRLAARRLEIWTDVPGMFSSDPRSVPSARLLRTLHYQEAQEIASAGGGVLHPRSISAVKRHNIPLFLKCTTQPAWDGTVISGATGEETPRIKAISRRGGITLIAMESVEMWGQVGFLADVFGCFRAHGLSVDLIATSESNVTVSLDMAVNVADSAAIGRLAQDLSKLCRVEVRERCAAVTLIGRRIRAILHELSPALEAFEERKVHLLTQASNDLNLTVVVDEEDAHRLVLSLHQLLINRFGPDGVFGPTLAALQQQEGPAVPRIAPWWEQRRDELLRIADQHGSVYVYSAQRVREAVQALRALRSIDAVFYSMKANAHRSLLQVIDQAGANFECVSPGEIGRVMEVVPGIDPKRILFTPNFAPRQEYAWALEQGVWVTLDNLYPLRHWPELFLGRELFIRIDTGQGRGHHQHVRTAGRQSKFGIPLDELDELRDLANRNQVRVVGLHAHTGSGVLEPDSWRETGELLAGLRQRFGEVHTIDLGGGLGIPEKPGQVPLDLEALDAAIGQVRAVSGDARLWLEPGRYIVAQAGILLARVTQTKGKGAMRYVGVSTGMNSLIRPALYGAYHEIVNLTRLDEPPTEVVTVVGPICETGDRLGSERSLPPTREGDVLAIINTGAYGSVMSSHYNLREPATEVLI